MSLTERTYQQLKEAIVQLELRPGTQLIETEVSERLGVSRTPVREAIKQLVAEGLATTLSPRMTVVSSINARDVEEIYEVRQSLEILTLELAFPFIHSMEAERIAQIYRQKSLTGEELYEMDMRMHHLWITACGNDRLKGILDQLEREVTRYRLYSHRVPHREAASVQEHLHILEAIAAEDLPRTRLLLSYHLENTKNNIIKAVEGTD